MLQEQVMLLVPLLVLEEELQEEEAGVLLRPLQLLKPLL
jgi:hypothetical protein